MTDQLRYRSGIMIWLDKTELTAVPCRIAYDDSINAAAPAGIVSQTAV